MAMEPIVNGLTKEFKEVRVLKVDIVSAQGDALAGRFGVEMVPTFLALSADGVEVDRAVGFQPPARLRQMFALCSSADGGLRHAD